MIGIDTNALLRAFLSDDADQSRRVSTFLKRRSADEPAYVNSVVLAELVWALRAVYEVPKAEIIAILNDLFGSDGFAIEHKAAALEALRDYTEGRGQFTDRLIAWINASHGAIPTFTFDGPAAKRHPFAPMP